MPLLAKRILGRADRPVPPVLWELTAPADASVIAACAAVGADWFLVPAVVATPDIAPIVKSLLGSAKVVVGVTAADLVARTRRAEVERIDALRPLHCAAVMVQAAEPSEMKSGGPFHRINNLRQQGLTEFVFAEAETVADAEWIIGNSPAHAVSVPFGIEDQTARFRVLAQAEELGTAILARRPTESVWEAGEVSRAEDLAFVLSHPAVAMVIETLPASREDTTRVLEALSRPAREARRDEIWARFAARVKEPPKPRGNHPPEYGS